MDDLDGFKTSVEEVTAGAVAAVLGLKFEVEPEDVTELLRSHKTLMGEELLLTEEQRQWLLEMESTPGGCCEGG